LVFSVGAAIPVSGTLTLNNTASAAVTTANSLPNVLVNGTNSITGNGNSGTGIVTLDDEGTLTLYVSGGSKVFDLYGTMTGSGSLILGSASMTLRFDGTAGDASALFNLGTGTAIANVRSTGTTAIALGGLAGGTGTQLQGDNSSGGANMTYTIGGAGVNAEFDGVILNGTVGTVAVIKNGGNTQTFANANTYSGGTTINSGALLVNNTGGSGTGSGSVTVAGGGTLGGTGIISGAVTVNAGGALAPGNPPGTLTISNNLTLAAGSTTFMQLQHLPLTNDAVAVSGTLTAGGLLNVTNTGATTLASGDSFQLFKAGNYSGAFANLVLPPLPGNLAWNTYTLNNSGVISVVTLTSPVITGVQIVSGSLVVNGSGGAGNWPFLLLTSTNLAPAAWTPVATNQFDADGNFILTNSITPGSPQSFYLLQLQ
jgi:autotransporter-associated beta strand protein